MELLGSCIQQDKRHITPSTTCAIAGLNLADSITLPVLYRPQKVSLSLPLGLHAQTTSGSYLTGPLVPPVIEPLLQYMMDEIISPDLGARVTPLPQVKEDFIINLQQEDSPDILLSTPSREPHSKQSSVCVGDNIVTTEKPATIVQMPSKKGPQENIPSDSQPLKGHRNSDASEGDSSTVGRRPALARATKLRKDMKEEEDDLNAEVDTDVVTCSDESYGDLNTDPSCEGSSSSSGEKEEDDGSVRRYSRSKRAVETVAHKNVPKFEIRTIVNVQRSIVNSYIDLFEEKQFEVGAGSSFLGGTKLVELKDEITEITETEHDNDFAMQTGGSISLPKDAENLIRRFSLALAKTVEGLTSKENALLALRFVLELATTKKAAISENIFTGTLILLETRSAEMFVKENGHTVKVNARCIAKQVYNAAVALRDKAGNLTVECRDTLQDIIHGILKCLDIEIVTGAPKRAKGKSAQDQDFTAAEFHCGARDYIPLQCQTAAAEVPVASRQPQPRLLRATSHHPARTSSTADPDLAQADGANGSHLCLGCGKVFSSSSYFQQHQLIHTGKRPHRCPECGQWFRWLNSLQRHCRVVHAGEKLHRCPYCERRFGYQNALQEHIRTHTGEQPYSCEQCGRKFSRQSHLRTHRRTHTGERPFCCKECGRMFTARRSLILHCRKHTGEKLYICPECGRQFSVERHLITHQYTHTGEKPFICSQCGHKFSNSGSLSRHRTVHTGERRFQCSLCQRAFTQKYNLIQHMRVHTRE